MNVIYSQLFQNKIDEYEERIHRFDEHVRSIRWNLTHNPKKGDPIKSNDPNMQLWVISFFDVINRQDIKVYYSFDSKNLFLLDIKIIPQKTA